MVRKKSCLILPLLCLFLLASCGSKLQGVTVTDSGAPVVTFVVPAGMTIDAVMGCRLGEKHTEFVSQVDFWDGTTTDLGTRSWYEVETGGILCEYQGYYRYSPRAKVSESTDGPPAWVSIYEAVPSDKLFQPKDAAKLEKQYQIKLNFGDSE